MMEAIGILCFTMATGLILTVFVLCWADYGKKYYSLLPLAALTAWIAYLCFRAI